jgi:hypothetical protein
MAQANDDGPRYVVVDRDGDWERRSYSDAVWGSFG